MQVCMKDVARILMEMEWCGVVEWVKKNTLRWFGHIERKNSEEFVKKVCEIEERKASSKMEG